MSSNTNSGEFPHEHLLFYTIFDDNLNPVSHWVHRLTLNDNTPQALKWIINQEKQRVQKGMYAGRTVSVSSMPYNSVAMLTIDRVDAPQYNVTWS